MIKVDNPLNQYKKSFLFDHLEKEKESLVGLLGVLETIKDIREVSSFLKRMKPVVSNLAKKLNYINEITNWVENEISVLQEADSEGYGLQTNCNKEIETTYEYEDNLFTQENTPFVYRKAISRCHDIPNLEILDDDPLNEEENVNCRLNYSDPSFFVKSWINDQKEKLERKKRRKVRKRENISVIDKVLQPKKVKSMKIIRNSISFVGKKKVNRKIGKNKTENNGITKIQDIYLNKKKKRVKRKKKRSRKKRKERKSGFKVEIPLETIKTIEPNEQSTQYIKEFFEGDVINERSIRSKIIMELQPEEEYEKELVHSENFLSEIINFQKVGLNKVERAKKPNILNEIINFKKNRLKKVSDVEREPMRPKRLYNVAQILVDQLHIITQMELDDESDSENEEW